MTAKLIRTQELLFKEESTFNEGVNSPSGLSYTKRAAILGMATCQMDQPREADQRTHTRKNVIDAGFNGLRTATITFTTHFCGLGADPGTGVATTTWFTDLLKGMGAQYALNDGGSVASATSSVSFTTTGVARQDQGSINRLGDKGDGNGDGLPYVVNTWASDITVPYTAARATPSGSAVRPTIISYPIETDIAPSFRFLFRTADSNGWYAITGCKLDQLAFEFDIAGGRPARVTFTFRGAYWQRSGVADVVALPTAETGPVAGGLLFVNSFGSNAFNLQEAASMTLKMNMGLVPQVGQVDLQPAYSNVVGWVNNRCNAQLDWTTPYTDGPTDDFDNDGANATFKHALFATNGTTGRCGGFYIPKMHRIGSKPIYRDQNGLLYVNESWQSTEPVVETDADTGELVRSNVRIWCG
jgi:hypothetical protein